MGSRCHRQRRWHRARLGSGHGQTISDRWRATPPCVGGGVEPGWAAGATGSDDGTARVWDLATGQTISTLEGHTGSVLAVAWSPDGQQVLTGSCDGTARVWDLATGQTMTCWRATPTGCGRWRGARMGSRCSPAALMAPPACGRRPTSEASQRAGGPHGFGEVGGVEPGWAAGAHRQRRWHRPRLGSGHRPVGQSPGGPHRQGQGGGVEPGWAAGATASADGTARIWQASGQTVQRAGGPYGYVLSVAWSPDGQQVLTASCRWHRARLGGGTGEAVSLLEGHTD